MRSSRAFVTSASLTRGRSSPEARVDPIENAPEPGSRPATSPSGTGARAQRLQVHGEARMNDQQASPPFQIAAIAWGLLTEPEMDQLIADHATSVTEGKLGTGGTAAEVRRSQVAFLDVEKYAWLYRRIWQAAQELNSKYFGVEIFGITESIQIARYAGSEQGFYTWHTDFADLAPRRKISISVQLSRPEDYEGGDLELLFREAPHRAERARGALVAFPSFVLHRVTPVTAGTRWSLVAWISGPRWR